MAMGAASPHAQAHERPTPACCTSALYCRPSKARRLGELTAGLVTLLAAKAFGADAVAVTDLKQPNLDLAKQAGPGLQWV